MPANAQARRATHPLAVQLRGDVDLEVAPHRGIDGEDFGGRNALGGRTEQAIGEQVVDALRRRCAGAGRDQACSEDEQQGRQDSHAGLLALRCRRTPRLDGPPITA